MASAYVAGGSLRTGDVFGRASAIWPKLLGPMLALYVVELLPTVLQSVAQQQHKFVGASEVYWSLGLALLVGAVFGLVVHGAAVDATSRLMDGGGVEMVRAIDTGMRRFLPLLGAWLLAIIPIYLGMILFVVPGLIVALAWSLVTPVCVLGRLGPMSSLKRSAALTKGSRWRLFGIFLLLGILSGIAAGLGYLAKTTLGIVPGAVIQIFISAMVALFGTICTVVLYRDLVVLKDGFGGERVAAVFN